LPVALPSLGDRKRPARASGDRRCHCCPRFFARRGAHAVSHRGVMEAPAGGLLTENTAIHHREEEPMVSYAKRIIGFALWLMCALGFLAPSAYADYPERTIRFIVPFPAGGSTDIAARLIADQLSAKL